MNKKTILTGLVAAATLGLGTAQASTVSQVLFSGTQQLSDNSAESLINNAGGATTLEVGDQLRGIFTIDTVEQSPSTRSLGGSSGNQELTGVFEIEVTGKVALGGGAYSFTFGPSANFEATYGTNAMVAFYADSANDFSRVDTASCSATSCLEATATGGSLFWVSGISGVAWKASGAAPSANRRPAAARLVLMRRVNPRSAIARPSRERGSRMPVAASVVALRLARKGSAALWPLSPMAA